MFMRVCRWRNVCKIMTRLIAGAIWLGLSASAFAGSITVSQPMQDGGIALNIGIGGVTVVGILKTDAPEIKAAKIVNTINTTYPGAATCTGAAGAAGKVTCTGATVTMTDPKNPISVTSDLTNEAAFKTVQPTYPGPPGVKTLLGVIDYEGTLDGLDLSGSPSIFSTSIGYDGLTDSGMVTYSPGLTTAGLTDEMYSALLADLPPALQPDLLLNGAEIDFTFAVGQTNYFVDSSTTDTGVELTGGIVAFTPEPASLLLVASGVTGLIARRYRPRPRA